MKDQKIKNESCGYFSVSKMLENGIHVAVQNFMGARRISDQYSKILENVIYIYIAPISNGRHTFFTLFHKLIVCFVINKKEYVIVSTFSY